MKSFSQILSEVARDSGLTDQDIAAQIGVCKGYFSRLMRHVGEQWARRMVALMIVTRSARPLIWMVEQIAQSPDMQRELAALRSRLQELERAA